MAEQFNLTTPKLPIGGTTLWTVDNLRLYWGDARIVIGLVGENGEKFSFSYEGTEATSLMVSLNKANLTIKSLHRRIMEKLEADGQLTGVVSGFPD